MIQFYDPALQRDVEYPADEFVKLFSERLQLVTNGQQCLDQNAATQLAHKLWIRDAVTNETDSDRRIIEQNDYYAARGEQAPRPVEGHGWIC